MAGVYKLWLVDKGTRSQYYWGEGTMFAVGNNLVEYFNQICKASNKAFDSADFSWSGNTGMVQPGEVVVYFLQNRSDSIVAAQGGTIKHGSGATYTTGAGTISEVYLSEMEGDADYARLVSNIAFHEILHNKLEPKPRADIHGIGGGGLSSPTVSRGMRPTKAEIDLMGPALSRVVPQYTLQM
jgi:hypothetical protein